MLLHDLSFNSLTFKLLHMLHRFSVCTLCLFRLLLSSGHATSLVWVLITWRLSPSGWRPLVFPADTEATRQLLQVALGKALARRRTLQIQHPVNVTW